jgi:hypothetical protein
MKALSAADLVMAGMPGSLGVLVSGFWEDFDNAMGWGQEIQGF